MMFGTRDNEVEYWKDDNGLWSVRFTRSTQHPGIVGKTFPTTIDTSMGASLLAGKLAQDGLNLHGGHAPLGTIEAWLSSQVRNIRYQLEEEAAEDRFAVVADALGDSGAMAHLGGGIYAYQINLTDAAWTDKDGETHVPYIWVTPSEEVDGYWALGGYVHWEDGQSGEMEDGTWHDAVPSDLLFPRVDAMSRLLTQLASTRGGIEATQAFPFTEAEALAWASEVVHDGRLVADGTSGTVAAKIPGAGAASNGWRVMVLVGQVHMPAMEADDGLRTHTDWWPMIYMVELEDTAVQLFVVDWHDGVTGQWAEVFRSYGEAIDYFADLVRAVFKGKHIDDVRKPGPPAILDHFAQAHPGETIRLDAWWDCPYGGGDLGRVTKDMTTVVVDYDLGKSGDGAGVTEFYCHYCSATLSHGDLLEDANWEGIELQVGANGDIE